MNKKDVVDIHTGILFNPKKERHFAICNNMDGPGVYYSSEVSQTEKDKYCKLSFICGI